MSVPEESGPVRPEPAACVGPDRSIPVRPGADHALDAIVIILVLTVVCGHWSADQVLLLLSLILAALGVRTIAVRRA